MIGVKAMVHTRRNIIGLLLTASLFALYRTICYIGAVSIAALGVRFLLYAVIFTAACLAVYRVSGYILPKIHCAGIEAVIYGKWKDGTFFLAVWGILTAGWLPAYLAFFPGIFGYDAPNQMEQILGLIPYSAHHPILHTMILGFFMKGGRAVFGSYNGGVALFCIFQGLAVGGSIAYSFLIMKKFRTPFPLLAASLAWCIWNPVLQVLTFNTTKDILFGALFLHFVLNCYGWGAGRGKNAFRQASALAVSGVLMCLLRNQGIYVAAALLLVSLFVNWRDRRFLAALAVVVLVSQLFFAAADHLFGVRKGDAREMLSVPMQQMALVCSLYMEGEPVSLTPEEFEKFALLVDREHIPDYHLSVSDPIKSYFNTAALREDLPGYLLLYLRVGLRNPGYYLTAFRCLAYPYWDVSENVARGISITNTFPHLSEAWGISQKSLLPGYKQYLSSRILYGMEEKIPVLSWLEQPGLCIWIMAALAGLSAAGKDKEVFWPVLAAMLFFGTLLLGPIALMRYLYPLTILTPWFFALLCGKLEERLCTNCETRERAW